jgi:hypothetical protein
MLPAYEDGAGVDNITGAGVDNITMSSQHPFYSLA